MTATERALSALRDMIFSGDMPAGSDHLEGELAERLGLSRTPVREACQRLAAQGLVEIRPRRGIRVLGVSPGDMAEIYEVLTALETVAVRRAASAGHDPAALAELRDATDAMDRALDAGDRAAWAAADIRFHAELVRLGGNSRAQQIVAMMDDQVRRARNSTLWLRPLPRQSVADHVALTDAIARGDADTAARLHQAHRDATAKILLELLEKHRIRQM